MAKRLPGECPICYAVVDLSRMSSSELSIFEQKGFCKSCQVRILSAESVYQNPRVTLSRSAAHPGSFESSSGEVYAVKEGRQILVDGQPTGFYIVDPHPPGAGYTMVDPHGRMASMWHAGVSMLGLARFRFNRDGGLKDADGNIRVSQVKGGRGYGPQKTSRIAGEPFKPSPNDPGERDEVCYACQDGDHEQCAAVRGGVHCLCNVRNNHDKRGSRKTAKEYVESVLKSYSQVNTKKDLKAIIDRINAGEQAVDVDVTAHFGMQSGTMGITDLLSSDLQNVALIVRSKDQTKILGTVTNEGGKLKLAFKRMAAEKWVVVDAETGESLNEFSSKEEAERYYDECEPDRDCKIVKGSSRTSEKCPECGASAMASSDYAHGPFKPGTNLICSNGHSWKKSTRTAAWLDEGSDWAHGIFNGYTVDVGPKKLPGGPGGNEGGRYRWLVMTGEYEVVKEGETSDVDEAMRLAVEAANSLPKVGSLRKEAAWWVVDEDENPIEGPFPSREEASHALSNTAGLFGRVAELPDGRESSLTKEAIPPFDPVSPKSTRTADLSWFWEDIERQLSELRGAKSADDVIRILGPESASAGDAFFAGSGGDGQVNDALLDAGWKYHRFQAPYYWVMKAPNGDLLSYTEGDVSKGDNPSVGPVESSKRQAGPFPSMDQHSGPSRADEPVPQTRQHKQEQCSVKGCFRPKGHGGDHYVVSRLASVESLQAFWETLQRQLSNLRTTYLDSDDSETKRFIQEEIQRVQGVVSKVEDEMDRRSSSKEANDSEVDGWKAVRV